MANEAKEGSERRQVERAEALLDELITAASYMLDLGVGRTGSASDRPYREALTFLRQLAAEAAEVHDDSEA